MDIRQWLANTTDREPPDQSEHPGFDTFLPPPAPRSATDKGTRKYRRKRKRASSEVLIIAPRAADRRRNQATICGAHSDDVRTARHADLGSRNWQSSRSASSPPSAPEQVPAKTYQKRARHKTRADRYDPKPKKPRKERDSREERKNKQKRRKSHRSSDGGRTTGLVQSFQLRNGPKNSRLTLKPDVNAGLFKHGRASAQVAGRGTGLPDLVFNEMRFLQKPNEHQDEAAEHGTDHKSRKKDRKRYQEEEISAYFGASKPVVEDKAQHQREPDCGEARRRATPEAAPDKHQTDRVIAKQNLGLPEEEFLGFGSRGALPHSSRNRTNSRTDFTWSDSPSPQAPRAHLKVTAVPSLEAGQLSAKRQGRSEVQKFADQAGGALHVRRHAGRKRTESTSEQQRGQCLESRRVSRQQVNVYKPTDTVEHVSRTQRRSATQSLPRQPSERTQVHEATTTEKQHKTPDEHDDYRTSDILLTRPLGDRATSQSSVHEHLQGHSGKENVPLRLSSPIGKLLRRAEEAVLYRQSEVEEPKKPGSNIPEAWHERADMLFTYHPGADNARHAGASTQERRGDERAGSHPSLPRRSLQRADVKAARMPRHHAASLVTAPPNVLIWQYQVGAERQTMTSQEDEMLDDGNEPSSLQFDYGYGYQHVGQGVRNETRLASDAVSEVGEAQMDMDDETGRPGSHRRPSMTRSVRGASITQAFASDRSLEVGMEQASGLDGFWKPHRLY